MAGAAITVKDSAGLTKVGTAAANGTFSIVVAGLTPPFMLQAQSGTTYLYSFLASMDMTAAGTQNVNITPITNLIVYELNGKADPGSLYRNPDGFKTLNTANVAAAQTTVRSILPLSSVSSGFDMMYDKFTVGASPYDTALDTLKIVQSGAVVTYMNGTTQTTYSSGTVPVVVSSASVALTLTDPTGGATRNSVSGSSPAKLTATVKDASGNVVPNAVVIFSTDPIYGSFTPSSAALTDTHGVASATLNAVNTSGGASSVTATTQVNGVTVSGSLNYAVGASSGLTLSALTFGASPLSAYGTTSVSVTVSGSTSPLAVSFTSNCASSGKATLTPTVTTVSGVATASYLDNGCNSTDSVTATVSSGVSKSGNLVVSSPATGSIQFVSVAPTSIALKGTGGAGRQETARVTFRVADTANHPVGGKTVTFALNTSPGGLALSSVTALSDPDTGNVVTDVISGTISTAVRVTATTGTLSTQSDQLVISTGIPAQDSFSLAASQHNIEGWNYDGTTTALTARLADHFHNPVPDGTAVYFTSEGGSVAPSCTTVGGVCSRDLTSQSLRPTNGRVTVLARAIGEEAFTDVNGNGTADSGELIDANGVSTSMGEAFLDFNENGIRDANEPYFDFNSDGVYNGPDATTYHGLLCTTPGAGICNAQKTIDVRGSQVIVFSTSNADIIINGGDPIVLPSCSPARGIGAPASFTVVVVDRNGNAMPAGTTVAFSTTNGSITSATSYSVPDTIGCRSKLPVPPSSPDYILPGNPGYPAYTAVAAYSGCPASVDSVAFQNISVTMKSDATWAAGAAGADGTCTDSTSGSSGTFTVTVTTPKGVVTTRSMGVTD